MIWFRTMQRFVPWLVGLFLVAQLAGIVPRAAYAQPEAMTAAAPAHHQHAHDHSDDAAPRHHHDDDQGANLADQCCALHLLNAVVQLVAAAIPAEVAAGSLLGASGPSVSGTGGDLLYRPPRSHPSL